jgi:hypothetical protein
MFSELPKLFDRNFVVGYLLPVAVFLSAMLGVADIFDISSTLLPLIESNPLIGTATIVLLSWLGGVLLLALNRTIIRIMEGYGRYNPVRLLERYEKRRFQQLCRDISKLDDERDSYTSLGQDVPPKLRSERNQLMQEAAERFPDQERWLLPTVLGNTIRAFEVYSREMYGLEGIQGWYRLLAVIPKDYRELVDEAKAQMDFWVNLWVLSIISSFGYLGTAVYTGQIRVPLILLLTFGVIFISWLRVRSAAVEWGEVVKSAFDVFLPELHKKLEFPIATREEERQMWERFSQAIIYRLPSSLPERVQLEVETTEENLMAE